MDRRVLLAGRPRDRSARRCRGSPRRSCTSLASPPPNSAGNISDRLRLTSSKVALSRSRVSRSMRRIASWSVAMASFRSADWVSRYRLRSRAVEFVEGRQVDGADRRDLFVEAVDLRLQRARARGLFEPRRAPASSAPASASCCAKLSSLRRASCSFSRRSPMRSRIGSSCCSAASRSCSAALERGLDGLDRMRAPGQRLLASGPHARATACSAPAIGASSRPATSASASARPSPRASSCSASRRC